MATAVASPSGLVLKDKTNVSGKQPAESKGDKPDKKKRRLSNGLGLLTGRCCLLSGCGSVDVRHMCD